MGSRYLQGICHPLGIKDDRLSQVKENVEDWPDRSGWIFRTAFTWCFPVRMSGEIYSTMKKIIESFLRLLADLEGLSKVLLSRLTTH